MARAKHTGRAEARRRYRQATTQDTGIEGPEDEAPIVEPDRAKPARAARQQPQAGARPGLTSAFRAAYHPANLREDFAELPKLVRHWSFFVPILMIVTRISRSSTR